MMNAKLCAFVALLYFQLNESLLLGLQDCRWHNKTLAIQESAAVWADQKLC